ncbi:MAG: hypothetical protein H0U27_08605 [Nitrosopumilus sp.]|nr:hypothetical protein [Nitrosopumilus sp.]
MSENSYFSEVRAFISNTWGAFTLGLEKISTGLGNLGHRVVRWLVSCCGSAEKTNQTAEQFFSE